MTKRQYDNLWEDISGKIVYVSPEISPRLTSGDRALIESLLGQEIGNEGFKIFCRLELGLNDEDGVE